jgi:hypothetical protein
LKGWHPQSSGRVGEVLGLPSEVFAVYGMTVGYPEPSVETEVTPRLPQPIVLHHEQYQGTTFLNLAAYDETMRAFKVKKRNTQPAQSEMSFANRVGV